MAMFCSRKLTSSSTHCALKRNSKRTTAERDFARIESGAQARKVLAHRSEAEDLFAHFKATDARYSKLEPWTVKLDDLDQMSKPFTRGSAGTIHRGFLYERAVAIKKLIEYNEKTVSQIDCVFCISVHERYGLTDYISRRPPARLGQRFFHRSNVAFHMRASDDHPARWHRFGPTKPMLDPRVRG